ncbi:MAG: hypothetical protein WCK06_10420 [Actinomycetota bacterium]
MRLVTFFPAGSETTTIGALSSDGSLIVDLRRASIDLHYISDLITGGLLFIVTIISAPDLFGWWRSVRAAKVTTPEQEPVALEKS